MEDADTDNEAMNSSNKILKGQNRSRAPKIVENVSKSFLPYDG
jgi:hypothetical protein